MGSGKQEVGSRDWHIVSEKISPPVITLYNNEMFHRSGKCSVNLGAFF